MYYHYPWNNYNLSGCWWEDTKRVKDTPESLRSAAKVLEDKAKELEKPELTIGQRAAVRYSDEKSVTLMKHDGWSTYVRVDSLGNKIESYDKCKKGISTHYILDKGETVEILTYIDQEGDLELSVVWPNC